MCLAAAPIHAFTAVQPDDLSVSLQLKTWMGCWRYGWYIYKMTYLDGVSTLSRREGVGVDLLIVWCCSMRSNNVLWPQAKSRHPWPGTEFPCCLVLPGEQYTQALTRQDNNHCRMNGRLGCRPPHSVLLFSTRREQMDWLLASCF